MKKNPLKSIHHHTFLNKKYQIITGDIFEILKDFFNKNEIADLKKQVRNKKETIAGVTTSPYRKGRFIALDEQLEGINQLRVIIDESIHACDFSIANPKVAKMSADIAKFLWRIGYRIKHQKDAKGSNQTRKVK